jgi:Uncharacterized protein conserved in bacteria
MNASIQCTAFEGYRRIASGALPTVAEKTKATIDRGEKAAILIFDDVTSEPIELDFRGSLEDVLGRLPKQSAKPQPDDSTSLAEGAARGPGRPRLGVVAREVTLLPRHWEWLNEQPGGASVALRKLVEEARRANEGTDRLRKARESAYRFMTALGGNLPGFEEASRALFAGNQAAFEEQTQAWPKDIRTHLGRLAERVFVTEPVG